VSARNSIAGDSRPWRALILCAAYYLFLVAGILALGYVTYVVVDTRAYQVVQESRLSDIHPVQEHRVVKEGELIGRIKIPRLGLEAIVVQGESPGVLRHAVGHVPRTALPGELGNVALAGHRDTFFRPLRGIQPGDAITIQTLYGNFAYDVESMEVVRPGDVEVLRPAGANTLTLVTCFPFYYVGPAPKRFIVHARQVELLAAQSAAVTPQLRF
jgi:sortase A